MTAKLKRGITKVKDPGSALTHFIAMILAIIAAIPLLSKAGHDSGHMRISALAIFILSMIGPLCSQHDIPYPWISTP